MPNQKNIRGSLFLGTLVPPSPALSSGRRLAQRHAETMHAALERANAENNALRQRLAEQSKQLRHTTLLLDARCAENAVMRQNIAELTRGKALRSRGSQPTTLPGVQA